MPSIIHPPLALKFIMYHRVFLEHPLSTAHLKGWGRGNPEEHRFSLPRIPNLVDFIGREIETLPLLSTVEIISQPDFHPPLEDISHLLARVWFFLFCLFIRFQGQSDRLHTPIGRTGDQKFKGSYPVSANPDIVLSFKNDPFLYHLLKEVDEIDIQGIQDLDEAVQRDGGEISLHLRDEPLRQISPFCQFFLRQRAQLPETLNLFPNLHQRSC